MFEQQASTPLASAAASGPIETGDDDAPYSAWAGRWDPKRASERIAQRAADHRAKRAEESARNAYADPSNDPDGLPGSGNWDRRKTVIAGACALAVAAGAIALVRQASDEQPAPTTELSASGTIDPKFGAFGRGATDAPAESALPATPKPQVQTAQDSARVIAPDDPLYAARMALDRRDLTAARARLKALPAQQQARPEFDALKEELANRELQRDAALQLARACERTSAWACVQQNAAEALALDGSNTESQAMLERVITHAGWLAGSPQGGKARAANTADNTANPAAATGAVAVAPAPAPAPVPAPAPANVASAAVAAAPATPAAATPAPSAAVAAAKPAPERHTTQRATSATAAAAAARQAALDEARAETGYLSRAEKIARAQAATNAVVAATIVPPTPAFASAPAATAAAPSKPAATSTVTAVETARPAPAQAAPGNGLYVAPSAQNGMYVAPSAPTDMYVAPAAPNGMYVAPTPRPAPAPSPTPAPAPAQHSTPAGAQSSAPPVATQASTLATTQTAVQALAQPAVSHAPLSATSSAAPAVRPVATVQTAVAATLAPTTPVASTGVRAAGTSAASTVTARFDADKSDDVERAIKQYGWSSTDAAPKPAR